MSFISSFPKVKLEKICSIQIGKTPSRSHSEYFGEGRVWVSISDLNGEEVVNNSKEKITELGIKKSGIKEVKKGTVLFSFKLSIGKVAFAGVDLFTNEAIAALIIKKKEEVLPKYLFYVMREMDHTGSSDNAAMGKTLNKAKLLKLEIPLPPIHIQKKIAEVLDKADAIRQRNRQILEKYDQLAESLFLEMFGDPLVESKESVHFKDVCDVQGGYAFKSGDFLNSGVKVVKISNVYFGDLIWDEVSYLDPSFLIKAKDFSLNQGDIIMALTRPIIKSLGTVKTSIVTSKDLPALLNQRVARLSPRNGKMNNEFLIQLMYSRSFKNKIEKLSATNLQPNVSTKDLEKIKIVVPPLNKQNVYSVIINSIKSQRNRIVIECEHSDNLFKSLLQKAFKGDLFPE